MDVSGLNNRLDKTEVRISELDCVSEVIPQNMTEKPRI